MAKNADTDKYKCQGHRIVFDLSENFSHPNGGDGKNVVTFRVNQLKTCQ